MSKVVKRLLTFFIGIPIVLLIVFCDYLNHLPLQITIGVFAVLGANEFYNMLISIKGVSTNTANKIMDCIMNYNQNN